MVGGYLLTNKASPDWVQDLFQGSLTRPTHNVDIPAAKIPFPIPSRQNMIPNRASCRHQGASVVPTAASIRPPAMIMSVYLANLSPSTPPKMAPMKKPTLLENKALPISSKLLFTRVLM